ncbi:MAG: hypothetical protein M3209_14565 [Acidobacteriota bacterium]|nr:hypothetical protein [Acidobacteriota bacterium]
MKQFFAAITLLFLSFSFTFAQSRKLDLRFVTDEADAVLAILAKKKKNQEISENDWQRVFQSEGFRRLKKREESFKRSFTEEDFKKFVLSDDLAARFETLQETFDRWQRADLNAAGKRALAYLPKGAHIKAKIYPVIKPRDNSFVFEVKTDPAIFLYLDPKVNKEQFENTVAHELHHIGFGTACPTPQIEAEIKKLPPNAQTVLKWIGAFGEGAAMLAAAGGADIHPHAVSEETERARWDRDAANFNDDLKRVEKFFTDVLANRLSEEETNKTAFSFFGEEQGAWYTVGWKMAVTIEKTFGREKFIEVLCDQRNLLSTYNRAAEKHNKNKPEKLALWSPELLKAIGNQTSK